MCLFIVFIVVLWGWFGLLLALWYSNTYIYILMFIVLFVGSAISSHSDCSCWCQAVVVLLLLDLFTYYVLIHHLVIWDSNLTVSVPRKDGYLVILRTYSYPFFFFGFDWKYVNCVWFFFWVCMFVCFLLALQCSLLVFWLKYQTKYQICTPTNLRICSSSIQPLLISIVTLNIVFFTQYVCMTCKIKTTQNQLSLSCLHI